MPPDRMKDVVVDQRIIESDTARRLCDDGRARLAAKIAEVEAVRGRLEAERDAARDALADEIAKHMEFRRAHDFEAFSRLVHEAARARARAARAESERDAVAAVLDDVIAQLRVADARGDAARAEAEAMTGSAQRAEKARQALREVLAIVRERRKGGPRTMDSLRSIVASVLEAPSVVYVGRLTEERRTLVLGRLADAHPGVMFTSDERTATLEAPGWIRESELREAAARAALGKGTT